MGNFEKIGLVLVLAAGMAFAQLLWTPGSLYGQVQFQWVLDCQDGVGDYAGHVFEESDENDRCYKELGGWWFGYVAGPGIGGRVAECLNGAKSDINLVEAKLDGSYVNFIGPDDTSCEGPPITDKSNGDPKFPSAGLELKLTTGTGLKAPATNTYEPDIAAFAVNFSEAPTEYGPTVDRDFSSKTGFCLTYKSDHVDGMDEGLAIELGWDEGIEGDLHRGYDTWISPVPVTNGIVVTKDFEWNLSATMGTYGDNKKRVSGDFYQDNWDKDNGDNTIETAVKNMRSFKVRLKQYEEAVVNFTLIEFGFAGSCGKSPIFAGNKGTQNSVQFSLNNKILSMISLEKPVSVQIFNLHGTLVRTQTLSPKSEKMNLNSLPTGVYLVRVPALGYVNKFTLK